MAVKVRSIEGVIITADSYNELLKAVKNELANYEGFEPNADFLTNRKAIIYHDEIEEFEEEPKPWKDRYCCECGHYDWGRGCPYREGHITLKMNSCHNFTVEIEGGDLL